MRGLRSFPSRTSLVFVALLLAAMMLAFPTSAATPDSKPATTPDSMTTAGGAAGTRIDAPATPSQTTDLYALFPGGRDGYLTTMPFPPSYEQRESRGMSQSAVPCAPQTPATGIFAPESYTYYLVPSEVDFSRFEHGQPFIGGYGPRASRDVELAPDSPPVLHWFLMTGQDGGPASQPETGTAPLVVPSVTVSATMRTGEDLSIDDSAFNIGDVIAKGKSEAMTLSPTAPNHSTTAAGENIYEFTVPLKVDLPVIPKTTGFNLRIDVTMDNPPCPGMMPNLVSWMTDDEHRSRLEVTAEHPIHVAYVHPELVGTDLVIHAAIEDSWGPQDIRNVTIAVDGPSEVHGMYLASVVQNIHCHCSNQRGPTPYTFVWNMSLDNPQEGLYNFTVTAVDRQGNHVALGSVTFALGHEKEAPAGGTLGVLLAVVGVAALARRRT